MVATMTKNPLARDLNHVLDRTAGLWDEVRGARVFITGGTGFFGSWLLETLLWANDHLKLGASVTVLTRRAARFQTRVPHLAGHPAVTLHPGDVRDFDFPDGRFSHVIHGAAESFNGGSSEEGRRQFDIMLDGTRRALEFSRQAGAGRFLLTSSGAIYGRQPSDVEHLPEEFAGGPDPSNPQTAGAEAKRACESLCAVHADGTLQPTIARCFAFLGPYLPLDAHFAAGNFIRDALRGGPIRIHGDGTPIRSYLYAADLAVWLWTILLRGRSGRAYNIGSEQPIAIAGLARAVAAGFAPQPRIEVARAADPRQPPDRYVPSTARARTELGLTAGIEVGEALKRTIEWHRGRAGASHVQQ
jgi:nucleoside-diphosphate-sugar epimerase